MSRRKSPGIPVELTLIRHGMTSFNEARRYLGQTDAELSAAGRKALRKRLQDAGHETLREAPDAPDLVFSGPMRRCLETAQILYGSGNILLIPEWTELDFGAFEGKSYEDLKDEEDYRVWLDGGCKTTVPGGESREDFIARSMRGYERMLCLLRERIRNASDQYGNCSDESDASGASGNTLTAARALRVAAVVHGGTIMALGSSLFGGDYFDYQLSCGGEYHCPIIVI